MGLNSDVSVTWLGYAIFTFGTPDGHYTMGPREAALACKMLGVKRVLPMHYGTFSILTGTPDELRSHLAEAGTPCEVVALEPGQTA